MATIKMTKKNDSYMCTVTKDSKDNTYIPVESALKTTTAVDFDLSQSASDFFTRNGNDLTILSIFSSGQVITNTVKNYFKLGQKYPFVAITQTGDFMDAGTYDYTWISNNLAGSDTLYGSITDKSSTSTEYLLGTSKNDSYKITNGGVQNAAYMDYIYDFKGNDNYLISANHANSSHWVEVKDYKGNDNYSLENKTYSKIYDSAGNDTYSSKGTSTVTLEDNAGKDTYNFYDGTKYHITDLAGNDNYNIYDAGDAVNSRITDNKGNDNYNIVKANQATITDKGGNDKYILTSGKNVLINETAGKDSYTLTAEKNDIIKDDAGNDKYTINTSEYINIVDKAGKDSYNIAYTVDLDLQDGILNETKGGNDTYNLSYISQKDVAHSQVTDFVGNDKYNIAFSDNLYVYDKKGSDSYVIKDSVENMKIYDEGTAEKVGKKMNNKLANDKYTIINSDVTIEETEGADTYKLTNTNATITDNGGNDKYNVTGVRDNVDISDYTASNDIYNLTNTYSNIDDKGGKDSYNITSSYAEIKDQGASAKDTYTLKNMNSTVIIQDDGGAGDTLKLASAKKNNLVFMANYDIETDGYSLVKDGSLFVFDKTTKGFVQIKDYYATKTDIYSRTTIKADEHGTGYIESILAGKKNVNSMVDTYTTGTTGENGNVYLLGQAVADWLITDKGYSASDYKTVEAILSSDIADEFIATFVQQQ